MITLSYFERSCQLCDSWERWSKWLVQVADSCAPVTTSWSYDARTSSCTRHVFSPASNRLLLRPLLRRSQRGTLLTDHRGGKTKTKCQCGCKILWQIPCLDLREESGKEGIGLRSAVHMQLLPPLLMQGALHCNLSLEAVYAEETDSTIQHNHHAKSHKLKYKTFDKIYKSMHAPLYKTGLFIEFIHCTAAERNRLDEIYFIVQSFLQQLRQAGLKTKVNLCNLRGLSCMSWSR